MRHFRTGVAVATLLAAIPAMAAPAGCEAIFIRDAGPVGRANSPALAPIGLRKE